LGEALLASSFQKSAEGLAAKIRHQKTQESLRLAERLDKFADLFGQWTVETPDQAERVDLIGEYMDLVRKVRQVI
jgi:hypothetical protein